jgi:hypothetical protein
MSHHLDRRFRAGHPALHTDLYLFRARSARFRDQCLLLIAGSVHPAIIRKACTSSRSTATAMRSRMTYALHSTRATGAAIKRRPCCLRGRTLPILGRPVRRRAERRRRCHDQRVTRLGRLVGDPSGSSPRYFTPLDMRSRTEPRSTCRMGSEPGQNLQAAGLPIVLRRQTKCCSPTCPAAAASASGPLPRSPRVGRMASDQSWGGPANDPPVFHLLVNGAATGQRRLPTRDHGGEIVTKRSQPCGMDRHRRIRTPAEMVVNAFSRTFFRMSSERQRCSIAD